MSTTTAPHSICNDCGEEFASRAEAQSHGEATMTPTGATTGITARGHTVRTVNPTPEEQAESRLRSIVGSAVSDALDRAFDRLDTAIRRGEATEEDVTRELQNYPDFADGWDEWREAGDDR